MAALAHGRAPRHRAAHRAPGEGGHPNDAARPSRSDVPGRALGLLLLRYGWSYTATATEAAMAGHIFYGFAVSVDGYIARGDGGDIGLPVPEEALHRHFNEMQERTVLNLYGRRMYEVMKY